MQSPPEQQSHAQPLVTVEHSRANVSDLKCHIAKKLGPDRALHYFNCLNGLLSQKLSKSEFNKLCSHILGKDNLPLHNHLIRSILHNAFQAKAPLLSIHGKDSPRPSGILQKKSFQIDENFNSLEAPGLPVHAFANGHITTPSPLKARSEIQNYRNKDQLRNLGSNGRTDAFWIQPILSYDEAVPQENGGSNLCNLKRSLQHHQGILEEQSIKKPKVEKESLPRAVGVISLEGQERHNDSINSNVPLWAPLGIPFFSASIGGSQRSLFPVVGPSNSNFTGNYDTSELCETDVLKKRMEQIAKAQGLEGVTVDCANLLNNGLDAYLKRLIASCVELVGARTTHEPVKLPLSKPQSHLKPVNGVLMGNCRQTQDIGLVPAGNHESNIYSYVTMQDLFAAMELKPQQLGEDWPLLLEKICMRSFEK